MEKEIILKVSQGKSKQRRINIPKAEKTLKGGDLVKVNKVKEII